MNRPNLNNEVKAVESAFKRKQIYINMDLQFKYSLILILTMFVEMLIVGGGLLYVFSQPKPDIPGSNIYFIYKMVLAIILFLTLCNITVGVYLSHKVAGPLFRFVTCAREVAAGNLMIQVNLRRGDELRELEVTFNEMTERLRNVIREDRSKLASIQESLERLKTLRAKLSGKAEQESLAKEIGLIAEQAGAITGYFKF